MVLRLNETHNLYNNVSWRPKSLTLVLWLTRILILPFWELHPLEPSRLFPSTTDVFCLDQLMKLVTTSILCMYYKKISRKLKLSVIAKFGCGCVHIFHPSRRPRFLFHISFLWLTLVRINFEDRWGYRSLVSDFWNTAMRLFYGLFFA